MPSFPTLSFASEIEEQSEGSPNEGVNEQGPWARRVYVMPWGRRWEFAEFLRGNNTTTGPTGPVVRIAPHRYPVTFAGGSIYAKDVAWVGEGGVGVGSDPLEYAKARVTVTYGPIDWLGQVADDPFYLHSFSDDPAENQLLEGATQELDYSVEWLSVPGGTYEFESDALPIEQPMNRRISVTHLNLTWHRFPRLPLSTVRTYDGALNDATFLGGAKGTVMFLGVKTRRELNPDGSIAQTIQMGLKWRKNDWNEFIRPDDGQFGTVLRKGIPGAYLHPYKDFRVLLRL